MSAAAMAVLKKGTIFKGSCFSAHKRKDFAPRFLAA
jgi:hypothetical protein